LHLVCAENLPQESRKYSVKAGSNKIKKGRPSARRLPLEWGSGEGVTEASLTPVNMQGGCFEPRTWCSVGELLTNCTKPALQMNNKITMNISRQVFAIKLLSEVYRK